MFRSLFGFGRGKLGIAGSPIGGVAEDPRSGAGAKGVPNQARDSVLSDKK
jgi:hypothetical protein